MFTLANFYKSPEWEKFRRVIIAERTDPETGFVLCAVCGKPIVKAYDLIVHHINELSEANVNDHLVSLNPENVECVHFRCHNKLHDRWQGGNGGWKPKPKQVFLVYGAPCSGKTTWVRNNAGKRDMVVDMDSLWQAVVPGGERYKKPDALRGVVFGMRDNLYDQVKHRSGKWQNAFIIIGGARIADRARVSKLVGATDEVFIDETKEVCLERLELRDMDDADKALWVGYIDKWFDDFQS